MAKKIEKDIIDKEAEESTDDINAEEESLPDEEEKELLEKYLRKLRKKEIRSVLLGNLAIDENGRTVAGRNSIITPYGIEDGAQAVAFWGIKQKRYRYTTKLKNLEQVSYRVTKVMMDIGRTFQMESSPDAIACRVKSYIFRPVVLIFEVIQTSESKSRYLQLTACCGRSPLAFIPVSRAVARFDKLLPKDIVRVKQGKTSKTKTKKKNHK